MSNEKFLRKIGIASNLFRIRKIVEVSLKHNEERNLEEIKNLRYIEGKRNKQRVPNEFAQREYRTEKKEYSKKG